MVFAFHCLAYFISIMLHLHNGILHSRKKEGAPTLCDSMDRTGERNDNETSQAVKEKYHMISLISGT